MGEPLSPDRVFDFLVDEPEPHPAYDFFVPEPLLGHAGNPNNNNGWIEVDVPLIGELGAGADELMVVPIVDEIAKPIDDDLRDSIRRGWKCDKSGLMAPGHTTFDANSAPIERLRVIEDLSTRLGNLEYRHGQLVKKVIQVSDVKVAAGITIGVIGPRFAVEDCAGYGVPKWFIGRGTDLSSWQLSVEQVSQPIVLERRGDCWIDSVGAGFIGSCAAERYTDLAAVDYGFRDEQP
ncbi:hypothetical protein Tco_1517973 [Tanacetum coccineum]